MAKNLISDIRNLQRRRARRRDTRAVLEGVRLVEEALAAEVPLTGVVASTMLERTPRGEALRAALTAAGVTITVVDDDELTRLADTDTPQGVIALARPRAWTLRDISLAERGCVLVLDGVQDPGNVGTIIRTAQGLGAAGVILLRGTARLGHPKVLRASMGAVFGLPVVHATDEAFHAWRETHGVTLWVADAAGDPVASVAAPERLALAVGSEAYGVRDALKATASKTVCVPLRGRVDSLNAAIAAGILLYEVLGDD